jgi:hypothetical protein
MNRALQRPLFVEMNTPTFIKEAEEWGKKNPKLYSAAGNAGYHASIKDKQSDTKSQCPYKENEPNGKYLIYAWRRGYK